MARAWVGTSGFSYDEWKPSFYPEKLKKDEFLAYYASRFKTVEVDRTFYRMPNAKTLDAWRAATPDGFRFAIKASQQITHFQKLAVPSEALAYLVRILSGFEDRLGSVLFQLPPVLRMDLERLEKFIAELPDGFPSAFEFRHESWLTDEVYDLLRRRGAGLVIHDSDEGTTPLVVTGRLAYLRLRKTTYTPEEFASWRERARTWVADGVDVYMYIKHEDNPDAPRIALDLASGLT
ncbi:MAG TPA: DUF72 domain-containing protein [Candidatus Polarisedimenticolaceae bacterium]|nr:DUF72 domain-containing protein [Candidatus Polarisedimenticolaceae bacterium]